MSVLYGLYYVDDEFVEAAKHIDITITTKGPSRQMTYKEFVNVTTKIINFQLVHEGESITISNEDDSQFIYTDDSTIGDDKGFQFYFKSYCPEIMNPILQELSHLCGRLMVIRSSDFKPIFITSWVKFSSN